MYKHVGTWSRVTWDVSDDVFPAGATQLAGKAAHAARIGCLETAGLSCCSAGGLHALQILVGAPLLAPSSVSAFQAWVSNEN